MTKAQLEHALYAEEEAHARCREALKRAREDRDTIVAKFLQMEAMVNDIPTEIPTRSSGQEYTYIDARVHLANEVRARLI